jgi:hypothetical protein
LTFCECCNRHFSSFYQFNTSIIAKIGFIVKFRVVVFLQHLCS